MVNFKLNKIPRCGKCRGYVNPFCKFMNKLWKCNLCNNISPVPDYYYSKILENGYREDIEERDELNYGCCEFVANQE